jgi:hypothetical protein
MTQLRLIRNSLLFGAFFVLVLVALDHSLGAKFHPSLRDWLIVGMLVAFCRYLERQRPRIRKQEQSK